MDIPDPTLPDTTPNDPSYKIILGITSLWMLYPVVFYITSNNNKTKLNNILCLWISITCIISYMMWKDYDPKSILYKLDMYFASGAFAFLIYITYKHT